MNCLMSVDKRKGTVTGKMIQPKVCYVAYIKARFRSKEASKKVMFYAMAEKI